MSFIEPSTSRAYDIVKPSRESRNLVEPLGEGDKMDADEARRQGWEEAAAVAEAFDAIDGRRHVDDQRGGVEILTTITGALL